MRFLTCERWLKFIVLRCNRRFWLLISTGNFCHFFHGEHRLAYQRGYINKLPCFSAANGYYWVAITGPLQYQSKPPSKLELWIVPEAFQLITKFGKKEKMLKSDSVKNVFSMVTTSTQKDRIRLFILIGKKVFSFIFCRRHISLKLQLVKWIWETISRRKNYHATHWLKHIHRNYFSKK